MTLEDKIRRQAILDCIAALPTIYTPYGEGMRLTVVECQERLEALLPRPNYAEMLVRELKNSTPYFDSIQIWLDVAHYLLSRDLIRTEKLDDQG